MQKIFAPVFAASMVLGCLATGAVAADKNPIFGSAKVTTLSKVENAKVAGKGAYADYYGYYGNLYSSYANYYGGQAYNVAAPNSPSEYNGYYYAYYYADLAKTNYYYAYYYSYYGY